MKNKLISYFLIISCCILMLGCAKNNEQSSTTSNNPTNNSQIRQVVVDNIKLDETEEVEYTYGPAELVCALPVGFSASDVEGEYLTKNFPKDVSSINQVIVESNEDPTLRTQDEFEQKIEAEYFDGYGENIDIEVTQYDSIVVDGRPGKWIMYNFTFRGDDYSVLMVILFNGNESNYITYMQGPGASWMDKFADSAMSLSYEE